MPDQRARDLRKNPTEAEKRLWRALQSLPMRQSHFRRQAPIGRYIADFCCHDLKLIIEVDGGQHADSATDAPRTEWLKTQGYTVLRFWNNDVLENLDGVMSRIAAFLTPPPLSPPHKGEGDCPKGPPMSIVRHDTNARMSQAVIHGETVYLAGQVSDTAKDVAGQTADVLKQIDALLEKCGTGKDRILSATIYLADIKTFGEMNKAWEAWMPAGHAPARTTLQAPLAGPQWLVEITIVAAKTFHGQ